MNVFSNLNFDHWAAALPSFIPALINILILFYALPFTKRSFQSLIFSLMVFFMIMWQMEETMMRLSVHEETAMAWSKFWVLGTQMVTAVGLHFTLLFTRILKTKWQVYLIPLIYLISFVFARIYISGISDYKFNFSTNYGWTYSPNDFLSTINSLWIATLSVSCSAILIYALSKEKDIASTYYKQLRLITVGSFFPAVIGITFEILIPLWNTTFYFPITSGLSILFSLAIFISLKRHKLLASLPKFTLSGIIENVNDGILIVDNEDNVQYSNHKLEIITGYSPSELYGKKSSEVLLRSEEAKKKVANILKDRANLLASKYEITIRTKNDVEAILEVSGFPNLDEDGKVIGSIAMLKDITETKRLTNKLINSEMKSLQILLSVQDSVIISDSNNKILFWNDSSKKTFGYEDSEIIGQPLTILMPERNRAQHIIGFEKMKKEGTSDLFGQTIEFIGLHKNGNEFPIEHTMSTWETENEPFYLRVIRDISERKKAQEKLSRSEKQIRNFASHTNKILEDERASIAREIHDELGQQLVGLKFGLSFIRKKYENDLEVSEKTNEMLNDVDQTLQSMRKIATQLRPGILDSLGLVPSIHWLVGQFEKKTGIKCSLDADLKQRRFDKNISINYFRICQEALTNISKHSSATEIHINVKQKENKLLMVISDNGTGISTEKLRDPLSNGLLGMRERARIIGSYFKIISKHNIGTTIFISTKVSLDEKNIDM